MVQTGMALDHRGHDWWDESDETDEKMTSNPSVWLCRQSPAYSDQ